MNSNLTALLTLISNKWGMKGKDIHTLFSIWLQILRTYLQYLVPQEVFLDNGPNLSFPLFNAEGIYCTFCYLILCLI